MWRTLSFIVAVGDLARAAAWSTVETFQIGSPPQELQGTRVHSGPFGYMSMCPDPQIVRFNLTDPTQQKTLNLPDLDPDIQGCFRPGRSNEHHAYFLQAYNWAGDDDAGRILRVKIPEFDSVEMLDLVETDPDLTGGWTAFLTDTHGFVMPYHKSKMARFDLETFGSVQVLDLNSILTGGGWRAGFCNDEYGYLIPYYSPVAGRLVRFHLDRFDTFEILNVGRSFEDGFMSGQYGYLTGEHQFVARFNLNTFDAGSIEELDMTTADSNLQGAKSFTDGTYGYMVKVMTGTSDVNDGLVGRFRLSDFSAAEVISYDIPTGQSCCRWGWTDDLFGYWTSYSGNSLFRIEVMPPPATITSTETKTSTMTGTNTSTTWSTTITRTNTSTTWSTTTAMGLVDTAQGAQMQMAISMVGAVALIRLLCA